MPPNYFVSKVRKGLLIVIEIGGDQIPLVLQDGCSLFKEDIDIYERGNKHRESGKRGHRTTVTASLVSLISVTRLLFVSVTWMTFRRADMHLSDGEKL